MPREYLSLNKGFILYFFLDQMLSKSSPDDDQVGSKYNNFDGHRCCFGFGLRCYIATKFLRGQPNPLNTPNCMHGNVISLELSGIAVGRCVTCTCQLLLKAHLLKRKLNFLVSIKILVEPSIFQLLLNINSHILPYFNFILISSVSNYFSIFVK